MTGEKDPRDVMQAEHDARLYEHPAFQAPAEMPGVEEIARVLAAARKARHGGAPELVAYAGLGRSDDVDHRSARAILDLFAPILAEKEREIASIQQARKDDSDLYDHTIRSLAGSQNAKRSRQSR